MTNATEQLSESDAQAVARAIEASVAKIIEKEREQKAMEQLKGIDAEAVAAAVQVMHKMTNEEIIARALAGAGPFASKDEIAQLRAFQKEWQHVQAALEAHQAGRYSDFVERQCKAFNEAFHTGKPFPLLLDEKMFYQQKKLIEEHFRLLQASINKRACPLMQKVLERAQKELLRRKAEMERAQKENPLNYSFFDYRINERALMSIKSRIEMLTKLITSTSTPKIMLRGIVEI